MARGGSDGGVATAQEAEFGSRFLGRSDQHGTKRGIGRGGFITSVQVAVDTFYRDVMEKLQPCTPPPPKLPALDAAADEDQPEATDQPGGEHLT